LPDVDGVTLTPSAVWRISRELVLALDEHLGAPVDSYVNGTQTWLTDDGPGDVTLEWRLHPVPGYRVPEGLTHYDVWESAVDSESLAVTSLWEGLECFPAYGDEIEPALLAGAARDTLGTAPDAAGLVDHDRIGGEWERAPGKVSMMTLLLSELEG
jgi:hypothetical protein